MKALPKLVFLLCLYLSSSLGAQEELKADPASDLLTVAKLAYQQATDASTPEKAALEYEVAINWFNKFLQAFPEHENAADAYYTLATCYVKTAKKQMALGAFLEVLNRTTSGQIAGAAALQVGLEQYRAQHFQDAASYLSTAENELPEGTSKTFATYVYGLCQQSLDNLSEQKRAFTNVINSPYGKKYYHRSHFSLGQLALTRTDFPAAYRHFQAAAEAPDLDVRAPAVHKCAIIAQKLSKTEEAVRYFQRVLKTPKLATWHPSSALTLMNLYASSERWDQITRLKPFGEHGLNKEQSFKRLLILAKAYEKTGNSSEANTIYKKLAKSASGTKIGFEVTYQQLSQAGAHNSSQSIESFLTTYEAGFSHDQRYESVKLLKAEALYKKERYKQALSVYQDLNLALVDKANVPTVAYRICKIIMAGENPTQALPLINQFVANFPQDERSPFLQYEKAVLLINSGENSSAISTLEPLLKNKKVSQSVRKAAIQYLAKLYTQESDFHSATRTYTTLLSEYQNADSKKSRPEWHFWLGYNQYKTEQWDSSKASFLNTRKQSPDFKKTELTRYLSLIAYNQKDIPSLKAELQRYATYEEPSLPAALYFLVAIEEAQEKRWDEAWWTFSQVLSPKAPKFDPSTSPYILETYAQTAYHLDHHKALVATTQELKERNLPAYQAAVNYYLSGYGKYHSRGAKEAQQDIEHAIKINPAGGLKYKLLLLDGKIEIDLGNTKNGIRLLKQVVHFSSQDQKAQKQEALKYLIQTEQAFPSTNHAQSLLEYQKELEQLK